MGGLFYGKRLAIQNSADYIPSSYDSVYITNKVKLYRDPEGMPHIYGTDNKGVFYAMGYATAQDRLWQLELLKRLIAGEVSAILGEDFIELDKLMRSLDPLQIASSNFELYTIEEIEIMQSYVYGINYFINSHNYY